MVLAGCSGVASGPNPGQLSITISQLPNGQVQVSYQVTLAASGGVTPYAWSITAGQLPPGLTLGATTGQISGTPTQSGSFSFTVTVRDSSTPTPQGSAKTLSITTTSATGPNISSISPTSGPSSGGTSVTITGTNFVSGATVLFGGAAATGVTVSSATQIRATTPAHSAGAVDVQVRNPDGQTATRTGGFTFIAPLQITTASLPGGAVGASYSATLAATGGVSPYSWSVVSGQLPPGLSLQATTGQISGTPTQAGAFSFTIQVRDSSLQTATRAFTINIATGTVPLQITTSGLPTAILQSPYTATLTATGGTGAYTWSIVSGALPPGLTLLAASGQITGTPTQAGQFSFTVRVQDSSLPTPQTTSKSLTLAVVNGNLDQYGGLLQVPSPNGATGHWRVEKFKNHWMFVTPDGNAFWSFGVFAIGAAGNAITKYGDTQITWGPQQVRRLRSWGFNTILDHFSTWVHPVAYDPRWPGDQTQPEKIPGVWFVRADNWTIRNINGYCPSGASAKDIFQGINTAYYSGWMGSSTDPFDLCFATWVNAYMQSAEAVNAANSPWVIGFSMAEQDYVFGLSSAGSSADFQTVPPGHNGTHMGYMVLITSPTQTYNSMFNVSYTDTTVYAKQALKNFLQSRYGTIAGLNAAWGSSYTTFDSNGGWGIGTGLLDEDGRNTWVPGDYDKLTGATAAMKQDLDDFLQLYAEKFFQVQSSALKSRYPWMMYFGPNVMGAWGTPSRKQILQAAGKYIDVLMTSVGQNAPDDQQRLDWLMQYLGDKPIASWLGILANPDSPWSAYGQSWKSALTTNTQASRGQLYNQVVNWYLNATVSPSIPVVGGVRPYVGVRWWAWADSGGEQANWGLTTPTDNAYDGKEAIIAAGTDPWGYPTGGEANNYGDFISAARSTNQTILETLITQLKPK